MGGTSQRRGKDMGRASGVSSQSGSGARGASARHGGRHRGVGGASWRRGISALSLLVLVDALGFVLVKVLFGMVLSLSTETRNI